jgi:hypothetical protein
MTWESRSGDRVRAGRWSMSATRGAESVHLHDRLLIAEALAYWASGHGSLARPADTADRRAHRAAELAKRLLESEELDGSIRSRIDTDWGANEGNEVEDSRASDTAEGTPAVSEPRSGDVDEADA